MHSRAQFSFYHTNLPPFQVLHPVRHQLPGDGAGMEHWVQLSPDICGLHVTVTALSRAPQGQSDPGPVRREDGGA